MPAKRRASKERQHRVTPEAVRLFTLLRSDVFAGCPGDCASLETEWKRCSICEDHREARTGLRRALGLKPWEASPMDVSSDYRGKWPQDGTAWAASIPKAADLRKQLEEQQP